MIRYILALVLLASVAYGQNASIRTNNILALSGSASPLAIQQTLPFRLTEYAKSGAVNAYNLTGKEVRWELLDSRDSTQVRFGDATVTTATNGYYTFATVFSGLEPGAYLLRVAAYDATTEALIAALSLHNVTLTDYCGDCGSGIEIDLTANVTNDLAAPGAPDGYMPYVTNGGIAIGPAPAAGGAQTGQVNSIAGLQGSLTASQMVEVVNQAAIPVTNTTGGGGSGVINSTGAIQFVASTWYGDGWMPGGLEGPTTNVSVSTGRYRYRFSATSEAARAVIITLATNVAQSVYLSSHLQLPSTATNLTGLYVWATDPAPAGVTGAVRIGVSGGTTFATVPVTTAGVYHIDTASPPFPGSRAWVAEASWYVIASAPTTPASNELPSIWGVVQ